MKNKHLKKKLKMVSKFTAVTLHFLFFLFSMSYLLRATKKCFVSSYLTFNIPPSIEKNSSFPFYVNWRLIQGLTLKDVRKYITIKKVTFARVTFDFFNCVLFFINLPHRHNHQHLPVNQLPRATKLKQKSQRH